MGAAKRLLLHAKSTLWIMAIAVMMGFLGGIFTVFQARQLSQITAQVFLDGKGLSDVFPYIGILIGLIFARGLFSWAGDTAAGLAAVKVKTEIRKLLQDKFVRLGATFTGQEKSAELATAAIQGIENLDAYISQYLPQVAISVLVPLTILFAVFPMDLLTAIVFMVTAPLIPFFMILIGKMGETATRRQWLGLNQMSAYFLDTIQGLTELKRLGRSRERVAHISDVSESYRTMTMEVLRITFLSALALELLATISTALVAVEIGLRLLYGRIVFVDAFFILMIAPEFFLPLRMLGLRFHAGMSGVTAAKRIFEVMNLPEPQGKNASGRSEAELENILGQSFQIVFESVEFKYPQREENAIRGLSLQLQSGQMTALVGASGAGKSSLAALLMRSIEPNTGRILLNDIPLTEWDADIWRTKIAWVPQSPYLFQGSIADNIRLAKPDATIAEVRAAARQANLDEVIMEFPRQYETQIGERGMRLSGGQAQRLALARAILRNAPILVLDEPTAHLDPEQESLLEEATRRLLQGKTALVIAHRLPTVFRAEHICVMTDGIICEEGNHTELIAQGGEYAKLVVAYSGRMV